MLQFFSPALRCVSCGERFDAPFGASSELDITYKDCQIACPLCGSTPAIPSELYAVLADHAVTLLDGRVSRIEDAEQVHRLLDCARRVKLSEGEFISLARRTIEDDHLRDDVLAWLGGVACFCGEWQPTLDIAGRLFALSTGRRYAALSH